MNIYLALNLLDSIPHNSHYLNRYKKFILLRYNRKLERGTKIHKHHILPKAKDMFPLYESFKENSWNKIELTPREHFISHLILCKAFPNTTMSIAIIRMLRGTNGVIINSKMYEKLCESSREVIRKIQQEKVLNGNHPLQKKGIAVLKDSEGNVYSINCEDPRYLSGEFVGILSGFVTVKDDAGKTFSVSVNDPRYLSGELKHVLVGTVNVRDDNNKIIKISTKDPRYINKELQHIFKGFVVAKDQTGEKIQVSVDDERLKTGELVGSTKGFAVVKDNKGTTFSIDISDERLKSGELVGSTKGFSLMKFAIDLNSKAFLVSNDDPRIKTGELVGSTKGIKYEYKKRKVVTCPYCNKIGGVGNMTRYHFDNCKLKK